MEGLTTHHPRPSWFSWAPGALVVAVAGILALSSGRLIHFSFDIPTVIRGSRPVEEVVIISMDSNSADELDIKAGEEWGREHHIQLLNRLGQEGPSVIVFDLLFKDPSSDPSLDLRLLQAMQSNGPVIVAAQEDVSTTPENRMATVRLLELFATNNLKWGIANNLYDTDWVFRRLPAPSIFTNLFWKVAEELGKPFSELPRTPWMSYYGSDKPIPSVSYYNALQKNGTPPGFFKDKVVFVGDERAAMGDMHDTPYTFRTGEKTSGVELQATAYLNLIREDWLKRIPFWVEAGIILLFGIVAGWGGAVLRPWSAASGAIVGVVTIFGVAMSLFWFWQWWFAWLVLIVVQIPVAVAWSFIHHLKQVSLRQGALMDIIDTPTESPSNLDSDEDKTIVENLGKKDRVPDHELVHCVAEGGYGQVWLARNIVGTYHAAKLVERSRFDNEEPYEREFKGVQRFLPISRAHPGWVSILHVGRDERRGLFYYLMELADDEERDQDIDSDAYRPHTLEGDLAKRKVFPLKETIRLGIQLADAMEYLHQKGLVHRDIKPANVVFIRGIPCFADIGLVTDIQIGEEEVSFVGTRGYLAPEGPGQPSADVYSLGKLLYQVGTGMRPAQYPDLPTSEMERLQDPVFLKFFEIIAKACEDNSTYRYRNARDFKEALESCLLEISDHG